MLPALRERFDFRRSSTSLASLVERSRCLYKHKLQGWHEGVFWSLCATLFVFILNLSCLAWAVSVSQDPPGGKKQGVKSIATGECNKIEKTSIWLHLAINALSTVLLSASNYTQQKLVAPTRSEVDRAHKRGKSLTIGTTNLVNLLHISWSRKLLWLLLGLTSFPLHMVYNSVVFPALAVYRYSVLPVTQEYLGTGDHINSRIYRYNQTRYTRIDKQGCIERYFVDRLSESANVILVMKPSTPQSFMQQNLSLDVDPTSMSQRHYEWLCDCPGFKSRTYMVKSSQQEMNCTQVHPIFTKTMACAESVSHCLTAEVKPECTLLFSWQLLFVAVCCNLMKVLCMGMVLWRYEPNTLVTLGDAIASFIANPDPSTKGSCLLSEYTDPDRPNEYKASRYRWCNSSSFSRWISLLILLFIYLTTVATYMKPNRNWGDLFQLGYSNFDLTSLVHLGSSKSSVDNPLWRIVLLVNAPQLGASFLYLIYNSIFSGMLTGREWNNMGHRRKGLRVTYPQGKQRSTYYLSIPFKYAIPLMIISGIFHWLISQSLFLVQVYKFELDDRGEQHLMREGTISTAGYSRNALFFVMLALLLAFLFCIGIGLRQFHPGMPVLFGSSRVISAGCHPPECGSDVAQDLLKWGVCYNGYARENESDDSGLWIGHCSITNRAVMKPLHGMKYK